MILGRCGGEREVWWYKGSFRFGDLREVWSCKLDVVILGRCGGI